MDVLEGKWHFNESKLIKVIKGKKRGYRVAFQCKGKYTRGLSISKDAFLKMEDVTITPGMRMELDSNVWLTNYGKSVHLVKYCQTHDEQKCEGGYFSFTLKQWFYFWTNLRENIIDYLNK